MIPECSEDMITALHAHHIYSIIDLIGQNTDTLAEILGISPQKAISIQKGAEEVIALLKRRTEMKKFIRSHITPRRGRSPAKVANMLIEAGVCDIAALGRADAALLKKAGVSAEEAETLIREAKMESDTKVLRELGIPAASLKKYLAAGISSPEDFTRIHPAGIAVASGVTIETVIKHVSRVCDYYNLKNPEKITNVTFRKGQAELLEMPGVGEATLQKLAAAGIYNRKTLLDAGDQIPGISHEALTTLKKQAAKP
jgi:DNA topoisomerase-1